MRAHDVVGARRQPAGGHLDLLSLLDPPDGHVHRLRTGTALRAGHHPGPSGLLHLPCPATSRAPLREVRLDEKDPHDAALGPVCAPCYERLRRAPAPCTACGHCRPLVGLSAAGSGVCGPCSGDGRNWTCRRCGHVGLLVAGEHCLACVVHDRVDALLSGPDGTVHPQLSAVRDLLLEDCAPEQVQHWLYATVWADLLGQLAAEGGEITHARLDALPPG
ncbi:hypothetical protein EST92_29045 [Streptomyces sp. TM32]|uniref:hypothetical protein n=1 Tax=Streptomyces sp. TM32 TaxID=1652669 RepID=UPI0010137BFB|nr:hypothetical protein [Streptomyces sp. TM32]RXS66148.1 hypothetical protein EST92_29045 [Streptomyces sp. TM32]